MEKQTQHNPSWWTDHHTSSWDRVKDSVRRDWEQTKADFSDKAQDLNQSVGDTIKQAIGKQPVPPLGMKTHPSDAKDATKAKDAALKTAEKTDKKISKATEAIEDEHRKLDEKIVEARKDHADEPVKMIEKIEKAQDSAVHGIQKEHEKIDDAAAKRDAAFDKWRGIEKEARYGFSVRSQYPTQEWNDDLEDKLHGEWDALETGRSWEESKRGIRTGWDYADGKDR